MATQRQHHQTDRHVDEESVTPAQPGDIRRHQPAAAHLADDKRNPTDATKQADGLSVRRTFQRHVQRGKNLRHDQCGSRTLNDARGQQLFNVPRYPAQQRGQAKARDAPHEQTPTAKVISQLAAEREADGEGHAVEGDNQLQLGGGGVQRMGDGVQRDVGD